MSDFADVTYLDRAGYFPDAETLVLADLHVGRVATSDVDLPMGEGEDLEGRLEMLLESAQPERVVVAGDLLHAFDSLPYGVSETLDRLADTVASSGAELVAVAGNHDTILEEVTDLAVENSVPLDAETVVHHGHEIPETEAERYVIGHEHPAITIEGVRHHCFLECRNQYEGASVLVLPSFNPFVVGTVVNEMAADDSMSPLVVDMDGCRPVVRTAEETLRFPGLGPLRSHL